MKCKICNTNSYSDYCFKHKPRKSINKNSFKRLKQMDLYKQLGEALKPVNSNVITKCFFCGGNIIGANYDKHHMNGRENAMLINPEYLVKVHHECHMMYHDKSWKKIPWWNNYLFNLSLNGKFTKILVKEQIKMLK